MNMFYAQLILVLPFSGIMADLPGDAARDKGPLKKKKKAEEQTPSFDLPSYIQKVEYLQYDLLKLDKQLQHGQVCISSCFSITLSHFTFFCWFAQLRNAAYDCFPICLR